MSRAMLTSATPSGRIVAEEISCMRGCLSREVKTTYFRRVIPRSDLPLPRVPERAHRLRRLVVLEVDVDDVLPLLKPEDEDRQVLRQYGLHALIVRLACTASVIGERPAFGGIESTIAIIIDVPAGRGPERAQEQL